MKVGIVGAGTISGHHLTAAARWGGGRARVVGVADSDAARASAQAARFGVEGVFASLAELLEATRPDVVHVLTPPETHAALAVEALDAGAHVLVETPMAVSVAGAEAIRAAAARARREVCVGHCWLYTPALLEAQRILASGAAGDVLQASASFTCDVERSQRPAGHWTTRLPGGLVEDVAVHPISLLVRLLGAPRWATASTCAGSPLGGRDDEMRALVDGERGPGTVAVSARGHPEVALLDVQCTRMLLRLNLSSGALTVERERDLPRALRPLARPLGDVGVAAQLVANTARAAWRAARRRADASCGVIPLVHAYYDALVEGRPAPVGAEEGLQTVRVLRAIWPFDTRRVRTGVARRGELSHAEAV
jgi:predicted dehydrogenase